MQILSVFLQYGIVAIVTGRAVPIKHPIYDVSHSYLNAGEAFGVRIVNTSSLHLNKSAAASLLDLNKLAKDSEYHCFLVLEVATNQDDRMNPGKKQAWTISITF